VGDQVLQMISSTLSATVRAFDLVARYGGEEFVLVLGNITPVQLVEIAERFRRLVELSSLRTPSEIGVTVSVGAAMAEAEDTPETLLKRADQKLYAAKAAGKNRVYA
jgi:diguanylate cyclase (GGDEF)-like protein